MLESEYKGKALITSPFFSLQDSAEALLLRLHSSDGTNLLKRECIEALRTTIQKMSAGTQPLVITGSERFFSAGADLEEIAALNAPSAYEFSKMGQALMRALEGFPAPVYAAISGYCLGGGLDLILACRQRIAAPNAVFGHRGAALGLMTGWGGTQRLPRLVGKAAALQMFLAAEKISAPRAFAIGLVDAIADNPISEALRRITCKSSAP